MGFNQTWITMDSLLLWCAQFLELKRIGNEVTHSLRGEWWVLGAAGWVFTAIYRLYALRLTPHFLVEIKTERDQVAIALKLASAPSLSNPHRPGSCLALA